MASAKELKSFTLIDRNQFCLDISIILSDSICYLCSKEQVSKLGKGKEDDEEHHAETQDVFSTL